MLKLTDFSAVIFDLDGLLLNTEVTYAAAWGRALAQLGYQSSAAFWRSLSGLQGREVLAHFNSSFPDLDLAAFHQLGSQHWRQHVDQHGIEVMPGVKELLQFLQSRLYPYALATNSPKVNALECLALAGLADTFQHILTRDDVLEGKPAPDVYHAAAERLGQPINQCLVLEDSYTGVLSGKTAGATVMYVQAGEVDKRALALADCYAANLLSLPCRD